MGALGFPIFARIRIRADFERVFRTGRRCADGIFRVYTAPTLNSAARLGMSVPRAIVPNATARNRIKRQIRESFRQYRENLPRVDIVVQALPASARTHNPGLRQSLEWHWRQVTKQCAAS